jgi:hypothetical protein
MPALLADLLLLAGGLACIGWYRTTVNRFHREAPREYRLAAGAGAAVLTLLLVANTIPFLHVAAVAAEEHLQTYGPTWEGYRRLVLNQAGILFGTFSLMVLFRQALTRPQQHPDDTPRVAGLRLQHAMLQQVVVNYWWLLCVGGIVAGTVAGSGPVLLLAVEFTLCWMGTGIAIRLLTIRH